MPQNPFLFWLPPMIRLNIAPSNCLIEVPPGGKVQISNSTLLHMNLITKFLQEKKKKKKEYRITLRNMATQESTSSSVLSLQGCNTPMPWSASLMHYHITDECDNITRGY